MDNRHVDNRVEIFKTRKNAVDLARIYGKDGTFIWHPDRINTKPGLRHHLTIKIEVHPVACNLGHCHFQATPRF
jgi:hypothetical protein